MQLFLKCKRSPFCPAPHSISQMDHNNKEQSQVKMPDLHTHFHEHYHHLVPHHCRKTCQFAEMLIVTILNNKSGQLLCNNYILHNSICETAGHEENYMNIYRTMLVSLAIITKILLVGLHGQ